MAYLGHDDSYAVGTIYDTCLAVAVGRCPDPSVILDLGARHGEGYEAFGCKFPRALYVMVEPASKCRPHIEALYERYPEANLFHVPGVLGDVAGEVELVTFPGDDDQSSNLYSDRGGGYGVPEREVVEVVPYSQLDAVTGGGSIDFAKVNIEGGEYDLVGSSFFSRVENFVMELHNGLVPCRSYLDVIKTLEETYDLTTYGNLGYKYCFVVGRRL